MSRGKLVISEILMVIVIGMCFDGSICHPAISYREPSPNQPVELTTTPKKVKDTFQLNKQVMPIPQNGSKNPLTFVKPHFVAKLNNDDLGFEPVTYKVKTAKLAEKPSKQSEDDDDDDDGGEYDGVADDANCKKKEQEESQEKKSMPMMIIRGFDVMAMDIPVPNGKKQCKKHHDERTPEHSETHEEHDYTMDLGQTEDIFQTERDLCPTENTPHNGCHHKGEVMKDLKDRDSGESKDPKDPTDKYNHTNWTEWSPCSKSCGAGVQARSRMKTSGLPDTQFRPCHLADCRSEPRYEPARIVPPQYGFREMSQN